MLFLIGGALFTKVEARWISGLRFTQLQTVVLTAPQAGRLALTLAAVIPSLPLSLRIAQCVTPRNWFTHTCTTVWDNIDACCGLQRHVRVVLAANCSEETPYITGMEIQSVEIEALQVRENIIGLC